VKWCWHILGPRLALGGFLYFIAAVFTYTKPTWFLFMFGPTLWSWQIFHSPMAYHFFFFFVATLIFLGSITIALGANPSIVRCAIALIPLVALKPWIALWFGALPVLVWGTNFIIDRLRHNHPFRSEIVILLIIGLLGPIYLFFPWIGSLWIPSLDQVRVLLYSIAGIRIILYCYDWHIAKLPTTLRNTISYFLSPTFFLINPSWIIAPRPSNVRYDHPSWHWNPIVSSLGWLIGSLAVLASPWHTPFSDGISAIMFMLFVSESLIGCSSLLGIYFQPPNLNRPWLAHGFVDFWNRFLGHTKQFINLIFIAPIRRRLRPYISNKKILTWSSLAIGFAILDIPIHYICVYSRADLVQTPIQPFIWFGILMAMIAYDRVIVYFFQRRFQQGPWVWINRIVIVAVVSLTY